MCACVRVCKMVADFLHTLALLWLSGQNRAIWSSCTHTSITGHKPNGQTEQPNTVKQD